MEKMEMEVAWSWIGAGAVGGDDYCIDHNLTDRRMNNFYQIRLSVVEPRCC